MSFPPPRRDAGAHRRRRLAVAAAAVIVLVGGLTVAGLLRSSGPVPQKPELAGPVATGSLVAPSGPGQTPYFTADSVPFQRPTWRYVGPAPWQLQSVPHGAKILEGYASRPSFLPGEMLRLAVSTSAPEFAVVFWRVSDRGAQEPFLRMGEVPHQAGRLQPPPTVDPVTRMVAAHWTYDVSFPIPQTWPSGVYLARLDSSEGVQQYVPFVVRSPSPHAVLVASSALDWEAYNTWGGSSLYATTVGEPLSGVTRALAVSFDRPYDSDGGAGQLFQFELPFLLWIARQGLDVAYTTDYDLSLGPDTQPMPKVVVFNGHSEYWGIELYSWLDQHVNQTGDLGLAMLAADTGYWPVTFDQETPEGPRSFTCLKEGPAPPAMVRPGSATEPPEPSPSAAASQPVQAPTPEPSEAAGSSIPPGDIEERSTSTLRAVAPNGPYIGSFADQPLFGVRYRGITDSLGRYTIAPTGDDARLLAGTGFAAGSSLGFIAGGEVDGIYPFAEWWGPMGGAYDHLFAESRDVPGKAGLAWTAQAVWREVPAGGRVFSAGTFYWGWALDPAWGRAHAVPSGFEQLTTNILRFLGAR